MVERERQLSGVACRRVLLGIGQTGGVAIKCAPHPKLLGFAVHYVGKRRFAAGKSLRQHRCRIVGGTGDDPQDQILHGDRIARPQAEFGW